MCHSLKIKYLTLITVLLLALSPAVAQDTDTNALDTVIEAVDALTDGYTYTSELMTVQNFFGEDDEFSTVNSQSVEGRVDDDDNYAVAMVLRAGESEDMLDEVPPLEMELLMLDNIQYVNFIDIDEVYASVFEDVDEGWQAVDELLDSLEAFTVTRITIENITNLTLTSDVPLTARMIESIEEQEPETIDGQTMRVFVVEIDAQQAFIQQNTGTLEQIQALFESADFLSESTFKMTYTLWIGADDGLLYAGESDGYTYLPYLTAEQEGPPYDLEIEYRFEFTIADHGTADTIELPEELES